MIKFKGLFDISLGGFPCIRGYAKLGDLAKASKADAGYQRNLLQHHEAEMRKFLSDRTNLFFPEVILSYKLLYDFNKKGAVSGLNPITNVRNKFGFRSNVDNTYIRFHSQELATVTIHENEILNRVDGNHRLSAVKLNDEFKEYVTPFCIIILSDDSSDNQKDKIIFHNINFKAIPLDEEHSLKIIIEDTSLFPDDLLKTNQSFGWEYFFARKIIADINKFQHIAILQKDKKYRTVIKNITEILLDRKIIKEDDASIARVSNALGAINSQCDRKACLGENKGVFSTLLILQIYKPHWVDSFIAWVEDSQLCSIPEISTETLLNIFIKRIESKSRDIFISLQVGHGETEKNFKVINDVINNINAQYYTKDRQLKLVPIRIDQSDDTPCTFQIPDKIARKIEGCGLFIADLTSQNQNVYHESGYVMGYIKGKQLENKIIFILHHEKTAENIDKKVFFNLRNFSQLRFSDRKKLKREIRKKIEQHYGLAS